MRLALILTFSPWEKERQGVRLECRRVGWDGQSGSVRVSQAGQEVQSLKFKVQSQKKRWLEMWLALILTFSPFGGEGTARGALGVPTSWLKMAS